MKNQCPICQLYNRCGKDDSQCWCMRVKLTEQIKAEIKALNTPESCLCVDCLRQLTEKNLST